MARDASVGGLGRPGHWYFVESSPGGCPVQVESRTMAPQSPLGGENLETPREQSVLCRAPQKARQECLQLVRFILRLQQGLENWRVP